MPFKIPILCIRFFEYFLLSQSTTLWDQLEPPKLIPFFPAINHCYKPILSKIVPSGTSNTSAWEMSAKCFLSAEILLPKGNVKVNVKKC